MIYKIQENTQNNSNVNNKNEKKKKREKNTKEKENILYITQRNISLVMTHTHKEPFLQFNSIIPRSTINKLDITRINSLCFVLW